MHSKAFIFKGRFPAVFFLAFLLALSLSSCDRFQAKSLPMPATPSIAGSMGWILVKESYARLKVEAGEAGVDAGHLRSGTILEARGRAFGPGRKAGSVVLWYLVEGEAGSGWVSSEDIEVFASREQAVRVEAEVEEGGP